VIYNQGRQYYLTVMVDITERKQLEDRLRQSQKMEAVGQLAGGMAHEFNNILAASMMALTLARTQITDSEAITHLDDVQTLSRRAADLIKQLLAFSRKSVMQREVLDMGTVVAEQCRMMQRLLGERITLEFNGTSPLAVEGDRVLLEQVIWNLCLNARDAMNGEGRLQLNLVSVEIDPRRGNTHNDARPGKHVRVSVTDTGCGMDEQTLKRLFEPFFTTKEVGQGTGLGLATVRGIVQQHQGWIEVESHVGVGTTFRVFLPASHEDIPLRPPMPEGMTGLVNGTLLLVEDEPALRKPTMTLLMRNGYRIIEAGDGEQGLALWEKHRSEIDLIITDMVMPGSVSGLDLAERALADKPGIKVIITSGYHAEVPEAEEVTDSPIIYLPKPWPPETLNLIIQTCLRHAICH